MINGRPMTIIGVMPEDFRFRRVDPAVRLPFHFDRSEVYVGNFSYQGVARLRPGVSLEAMATGYSGRPSLATTASKRGRSRTGSFCNASSKSWRAASDASRCS